MQREFKINEIGQVVKEFLKFENSGVIGFSGNLGAGKTTFTKEILKQLGHGGNVISPTFVLRRDYEIKDSLITSIGPIPSPSPAGKGIMQSHRTANLKNYSSLKTFAKEMRKEPTGAEEFLWKHLNENKLGVRFRRQHIIKSFVVDFVCIKNNLIIEIDGKIHDEQKEKDEERTKILESLGFKVLRFTNEQVLNNIDFVISEIKEALKVLPVGEDLGGAGLRRIIHIDAYRLEKPEQIYQVISKEELADKNNLIIIEWPEKVDQKLFDKIFLFEHIDENTRRISLK